MSKTILIKDASLVNEGAIYRADLFIAEGRVQKVGSRLPDRANIEIDGKGKFLLPGVIDGQVHFREPGLEHKGDMLTESRAAVAGGVTSFIDMPNTIPNVLTDEALKEKYEIASRKSLANHAFFMGVNGDNMDEVINSDTSKYIGVSDDGLYFTRKGNLLADNPHLMEKLFASCKAVIAIHSEKEQIIEQNEEEYRKQYGENVPVNYHPLIRSERACLEATRLAIEIAKKHGTRLHVLHLTTAVEAALFENKIPLEEKLITTEVSVHHLWFSDKDYERLGTLIKWNPAIKTEDDRRQLLNALLNDNIDLVTTDHAPHAMHEKQKPYFQSMSGAPMVQHSLNCMLEFHKQGLITLEKIVEKMCHNPAILYGIVERGFIREGYHADLTLVDLDNPWVVKNENILYKCGWSPLLGTTFHARVTHTLVNGNVVYENGHVDETFKGKPLEFKTR